MSAAPTADAARPATVTPPDAPGTVGRNVRIDLGRVRERDPISVAQVSAVAVATAPPNPAMSSERIRPWVSDDASARIAATPPLAITCTASRSLPASLLEVHSGWEPAEQRRRDEERDQHRATADPRPRDHRRADRGSGQGATRVKVRRTRRAASEIVAAPARPIVARARSSSIIVRR